MCCALPLPFLNDFDTFAGLIWFLLFFGGAILPSLTGVMLNTVNINQKTTANALANLCYNLFGYLPAPFIYGMIYDAGDGGNVVRRSGVALNGKGPSVLMWYKG